MRGLFLSFSHRSPILLVGLLSLSTHLLWAQRTPPIEKIPIQLLDTPAPFARVSEAQTRLHLTYRKLPLTFEKNPGMTLFPHSRGTLPEVGANVSHLLGALPMRYLSLPHNSAVLVAGDRAASVLIGRR